MPVAAIDERAASLWDEVRAAESEAAFAATELAYAAVSFEQVAGRVDAWRGGMTNCS